MDIYYKLATPISKGELPGHVAREPTVIFVIFFISQFFVCISCFAFSCPCPTSARVLSHRLHSLNTGMPRFIQQL